MGGQHIARLARTLPDPEDPQGEFDEYKKLRTKLNDYFIPKRNRHYARYLFLKLRPEREESTVAYATRLREKTHDCNFGVNCDERILEHLIQTIENSTLIEKCISKSWTLQEFLTEAGQIEGISHQMQDMKPNQWNKEIHKVEERQWNDWTQRNLENTTQPCSYCGLEKAHPKGRNCPAYGVQCEICNKFNHYTSVCRAYGRKQHTRQPDKQMRRWRIKKAEEGYSEIDSSSDDEFLSSVQIKAVKNLSEENLVLSRQIDCLQDIVSRFGKEIEAAKEIISSLLSQQIHKEHYPSEEIEQQQQKDFKQSLHVQTTVTKDIQETQQYGGQDNGDTKLKNLRTCLEQEGENGRRNTVNIQTNRKGKRKGKRR